MIYEIRGTVTTLHGEQAGCMHWWDLVEHAWTSEFKWGEQTTTTDRDKALQELEYAKADAGDMHVELLEWDDDDDPFDDE